MIKPYYQDKWVTIYHIKYKVVTMGSDKKAIVNPVFYVPPPDGVVEAAKNADKPRITIIKGYSIK